MHAPIRVVHTADLHLGSPFRAFPEQAVRLQDEQLALFARLMTLCAERQVQVLLIAGDLFDQPLPSHQLARTVSELLATIPDTAVFIAAGNHDPAFIDSPYRTLSWPDHVRCFTDAFAAHTMPGLPVRVHGAGFTATAASRCLLPTGSRPAAPDRLNLLAVHGDLVTRGQDSVYNPVTLEHLAALGMDYTALGHRHEATGLLPTGRGCAAYCGCPLGRGFDETGQKSVQLLAFSDSGRNAWQCFAESVYLGGRRFEAHVLDVTGCETHEAIADRIRARLAQADPAGWAEGFHRMVLIGESSDRFRIAPALLAQMLAHQLFHIEVIDRTEPRIDLEALSRESSLRGTFARLMAEQLAEATRQDDRLAAARCRRAMEQGLAAFSGEVALRADP